MEIKDECFRLSDIVKQKGSQIDYLYTVVVPEGVSDSELVMAS